jgi:hypothetical protein
MKDSLDDYTQRRIERVSAWFDENVRVYPTPREVTLSEFEIDWDKLAGSFRLAFDGEPLPDRFRFSLEITGWLQHQAPMFVSPLDVPASYAAVEFTDDTRRAIDDGLRATLPRLHGYGIVRESGKEIGAFTPLAERIVDRAQFESAKAKASASEYSITVCILSDAA